MKTTTYRWLLPAGSLRSNLAIASVPQRVLGVPSASSLDSKLSVRPHSIMSSSKLSPIIAHRLCVFRLRLLVTLYGDACYTVDTRRRQTRYSTCVTLAPGRVSSYREFFALGIKCPTPSSPSFAPPSCCSWLKWLESLPTSALKPTSKLPKSFGLQSPISSPAHLSRFDIPVLSARRDPDLHTAFNQVLGTCFKLF